MGEVQSCLACDSKRAAGAHPHSQRIDANRPEMIRGWVITRKSAKSYIINTDTYISLVDSGLMHVRATKTVFIRRGAYATGERNPRSPGSVVSTATSTGEVRTCMYHIHAHVGEGTKRTRVKKPSTWTVKRLTVICGKSQQLAREDTCVRTHLWKFLRLTATLYWNKQKTPANRKGPHTYKICIIKRKNLENNALQYGRHFQTSDSVSAILYLQGKLVTNGTLQDCLQHFHTSNLLFLKKNCWQASLVKSEQRLALSVNNFRIWKHIFTRNVYADSVHAMIPIFVWCGPNQDGMINANSCMDMCIYVCMWERKFHFMCTCMIWTAYAGFWFWVVRCDRLDGVMSVDSEWWGVIGWNDECLLLCIYVHLCIYETLLALRRDFPKLE